MEILRQNRTRLWGVSLAAVVLLTSACIDGEALPPIEPTPAMAIPSAPGPTVSGGPAATEQESASYGTVSLFLGASDAKANERGIVTSASVGAKCAKTRGCQPGAPTRPADQAFSNLATNVASAALNGGSGTVLLQGNVDNQRRRITGDTSIELARNRAAQTAAELEAQLIRQGVPRRNILTGAEIQGANCSAPGIVCIQTQADPSVIAACRGADHCAERAGAQRATSASATITPNRSLSLPDPACRANCTTGASGTPSNPIATSGTPGVPNPGAGIFGPGPVSSGGTPSGPGPAPVTTPVATGPNDSDGYCAAYPADCLDVADEDLSVRITVAAPNVFRVGARLREQDVTVESVVLYCGGVPCPVTGALRVGDFRGTLSLPSSSASYRLCATPRSANCEYYLSPESTPAAISTGSSIDGGLLRAGFLTPTPSTPAPAVKVRPTLDVDVLVVEEYVPVWVGGDGCDGTAPARTCWAWETVDTLDMRGSVSVRTTGGEPFTRSGNRHSIDRIVVGTVGS